MYKADQAAMEMTKSRKNGQ